MQDSIIKISEIIWNKFKYKKALFAVSSLWLGHASRTLPVIKHYLDLWFEIKLISFWNALIFLKKELSNYSNVYFVELEDYPPLERWIWISFYYYLLIDITKLDFLIRKENEFIKKMNEEFDFIFSDWKYWIYKTGTPSYLVSHQISFLPQKWLTMVRKIADFGNYNYFKKFSAILIPDFENEKKSLAWKLSHSDILKKLKHYYIWTLTSYEKPENSIVQDIDYYFIISWYLVEHKDNFIKKLVKEAQKLEWKKIFVLWDNSTDTITNIEESNITIYSNISWEQRINFFHRAKIIISRAWYTTIMDLVANNKKAILFPTKNQTEQEYLAKYLDKKWLFVNWGKTKFDLQKLVSKYKKII